MWIKISDNTAEGRLTLHIWKYFIFWLHILCYCYQQCREAISKRVSAAFLLNINISLTGFEYLTKNTHYFQTWRLGLPSVLLSEIFHFKFVNFSRSYARKHMGCYFGTLGTRNIAVECAQENFTFLTPHHTQLKKTRTPVSNSEKHCWRTNTCPLLCPDCREGGNKRCFCPSVCLSVTYIANNSRTQRPLACPNLEGRFPNLDATHTPVSRSNGQRSGLEAGGGIPCCRTRQSHCMLWMCKLLYSLYE